MPFLLLTFKHCDYSWRENYFLKMDLLVKYGKTIKKVRVYLDQEKSIDESEYYFE